MFLLWCQDPLGGHNRGSSSGISRHQTINTEGVICDIAHLQVPCDPRDAAIMQAIEEGDAAVRRVFQRRLHAALGRHCQSSQDAQQADHSDSEM